MPFRFVDAFSGIGGASAGAMAAGCRIEMGIELDDKILRPYATNTGGRAVCATIGKDEIPWPEAAPDVMVHLSPPCTALSKARAGSASEADVASGLDLVRASLDLVVEKKYLNWSLENVSTMQTRALADAYCQRYPDQIAYVTLDAADFGVPQNRTRLIVSSPGTIKLIREQAVRRVTVSDAFVAAGVTLPATHVKSNTTNRDGTPCIRSVQEQAFTVTASHPLIWCSHDGTTVRCMTAAECALLQGFQSNWRLPTGSRLGIRAAGNAIPPPLAATIVRCAAIAAGLEPTPPQPVPQLRALLAPAQTIDAMESGAQPEHARSVSIAEYKSLKRRVELLEAAICGMRRV